MTDKNDPSDSDIDWFTVCRNFAHHDLTWNTTVRPISLYSKSVYVVDWCKQHPETAVVSMSERLQQLCQYAGYTLYFYLSKPLCANTKWGRHQFDVALIMEHTASGRLHCPIRQNSACALPMRIGANGMYIIGVTSADAYITMLEHNLHRIPQRLLRHVQQAR